MTNMGTLKFLAAFERNPWSSCTTLHLSLNKSLNTALLLVQKLAGSTGASKCLQKFKCGCHLISKAGFVLSVVMSRCPGPGLMM